MTPSNSVINWVGQHSINTGLEIRSYQVAAWDLLWAERAGGRKRALIHLATGLGKTSVAAVDVLHYQKTEHPGGRALFVSHMRDISRQSRQTFLKVHPQFSTQTYRSGRDLLDVDVTFTTFQALHRNLDTIDPDHFDYIIYDEAHHIEAETFSQVREHFRPKFELGLTATPERADGLDIFEYFGQPIFSKGLAEGMAEGWLSAVDYHIVFDDTVKDAMDKSFSLETLGAIREVFSIKVRNEVIAKNVLDRRQKIGMENAKTIVFCQNTESAAEMATLLDGKAYHSRIDKDKREAILAEFRAGNLQVICTVDMFNEGIDIPDARLVVFLRSTSSRTVFEQQLGRGLRKHPGKEYVTILDFVANVERINFVRELGRHTDRAKRRLLGLPAEGHGGRAGADYHNNSGHDFSTSRFDFEDQTIELLERYEALKNVEYVARDKVVAAYKELGNVAKVAERFQLSTTAIYNHLRKAGIDTSGKLKGIPTEVIVAKYYELQSARKTAEALGMDISSIHDRLRRAGVKLLTSVPRYTNQELIEAYERNGRNLRQTSRDLDQDRTAIYRRLKRLGVDTSRPPSQRLVPGPRLNEYYKKYDGDIHKIIEKFPSYTRPEIYKSIEANGYLDNPQRPITSAQAAAARYKFGNATKAAEQLGISNAYVIRLTKDVPYMPKYKQSRGVTV